MNSGTLSAAFLLRDAGEGGAERSSLRLANGLARRGVKVTAMFLRKRGPMLDSIDKEIKIVGIGRSFAGLIAELRSGNYDFLLPIYTAMRSLIARWVLLKLSPGGHAPRVILSQRSMFTLERGPIQTKVRTMRYRVLAPLASACVCISRGVADEMRSLAFLPPDKIHVIYNAVVTDELKSMINADDAAPHPWLELGQPPVILGAGRLGSQKDFPALVRAFDILSRKRPDVRLIIIGEGKERGRLQSMIDSAGLSDRACLPGYDVNPYAWMKRAAVFALTSRYEGFGNVVAEALACGCNVVSADCPSGPAEILGGGKYGRLVRLGDDAAMAEALNDAIEHPMPSDMLRERAEFFSEARAAEEWLTLMQSIKSQDASV